MVVSRQPLIAGNWKMNGLRQDSILRVQKLVTELSKALDPPFEMLVCPPVTLLDTVGAIIRYSAIKLGAQDCHAAQSGAHTGNISAEMLADMGCSHVIVGHSERRLEHDESNDIVKSKTTAALESELAAIICIGETKEQRDAGETDAVIIDQLTASVSSKSSALNTIVAYEPVWAIGTGHTPKITEIGDTHAIIREKLAEILSPTDAEGMRILYGGSVNPSNAHELLMLDDVDGALVGGASLHWEDFWAIAECCGK